MAHLGLEYSGLPKFIQKIDLNARMPMMFMDSVDKSAFYIVFSRNIFIPLVAMYSIPRSLHFGTVISTVKMSVKFEILLVRMRLSNSNTVETV